MRTEQRYRGRFAPSPTGLLHLGHAATFLAAYDRACAAGGVVLLRHDDLDAQRSRESFIEAARDDLRWLGMNWADEVRQSTRLTLYREAIEQLVAAGFAYPCDCSRKELQQAAHAPHEDAEDEPIYSGRCRPANARYRPAAAARAAAFAGVPHPGQLQADVNYRFHVPDDQTLRFADGHCGPQQFTAGCNAQADFGDFLLWRKDGLPSYQLACVVDDAAMGITEVVRGRDLLKSTARQILLQRALGLPMLAYFHTELVRDRKGERLAKRHDAMSLRCLREQGLVPAEIRSLAKRLASEPA